MGKHSKTDSSSPLKDKYNHKSGWLSGMLHVLDFPRWRAKNRPTCWKTPRTHSLVHETEEQEQPFLDSQDSKILSVVPEKDPKKRELRKTMTTKQVTEYVDILEILRKEDVVVKIMKDPDSEFGKKVQIKSNPRFLPKSGSFPLPGSSRPARIEHKQKENWYAPKQNGAVLTLNVPRERDTSHQENKPTLPSHDGSSDDHGFNHTVVNGFREIKKLLKKAIKDRKHTKKSKKYSSVSKDDDPMGRYLRLLEQSFERKSAELRSKSLRLSYEEKNIDSRDDNKPIFFRRVSSLSSLEVLGSFLTELPRDSTIKKSLDQDSTNFGSKKPSLLPETPAKTEKQEEEERDEEKEEISQENRIDTPNQRISEQDYSDNTAQKTEDLTLQGLCLQEEEHEDTCFCYVKKVLKLSGLLENKHTGEKWYSEEQPLNPSLLYQLEIQEEEEEVNKEILFDLINEAIVETHNKSEIYFSYTNEKRFLDQVWRRVEWSLYGLGAENKDCSLDDIVGKDLKRGDDQWMNLRSESQCLILELEDLIFDDVLHELLSVYY
ncbi:unnamed protein product [Cochlearia groenlandica]